MNVSTSSAPLLDAIATRGLQRGLRLPDAPIAWRLATLCGRLAEISGNHACATLTLVFRLVLEAQRAGEPVAWIGRRDSPFFPPDVADAGVDLEALAVVWMSEARLGARAADHLLRSGAFGLVVLDFGTSGRLQAPMQTRLAGLAKKHDSAMLCLTEKDGQRPSLGSLVSFRAETMRVTQRVDAGNASTERVSFRDRPGPGNRYRCELRVLKDKRRGPGWMHVEVCHGPDGLC